MKRIVIPREVLLVEIERRCTHTDCNAKTHISLTKGEARAYSGFECERCERWNDDVLTERDAPDWWEELTITGLHSIRDDHPPSPEEPGEMITRMSESYKRIKQ
jgi:hypothetical protein